MPVCSFGSQQGEAEDVKYPSTQATGVVDFNSILLCLLRQRLWGVIPSAPSLLPENGDRDTISFCSNNSVQLSPVDLFCFILLFQAHGCNGRLPHLGEFGELY